MQEDGAFLFSQCLHRTCESAVPRKFIGVVAEDTARTVNGFARGWPRVAPGTKCFYIVGGSVPCSCVVGVQALQPPSHERPSGSQRPGVARD